MPSMHELTSFCWSPDKQVFAQQTIAKALGHSDVLIKTTHSGLCTTDVHALAKGCGLGHEGVGVVKEVGNAVTSLQVGQRVGWGWLHSSCGHCKTCATGYRQYCSQACGFAFSDTEQGALGDYRIINSEFAYPIPSLISSLHAGPLMCAGASTYEALDAAGAKPNHRVGVFGIGGLGHMAILFAKAMGCGITALSNGSAKKLDAFAMGADEFRDVNDLGQSHTLGSETQESEQVDSPSPMNIDVLLVTSNAVPDLQTLFPLLARRAIIVLMTIQEQSISVPYMPFILPGHRIIASTEASRQNHYEMLEFVARHGIKPWVEEFPMDAGGVAKVFERLQSGKMRYRGVLVRNDA